MTSSLPNGRPVALISPLYPPDKGGLASACARLAAGLARHVPVEVLAPSHELAPGEVSIEADGAVTVVRLGPGKREDTQRQWFELLTNRGPYRLVHGVYLSETGFLASYAARYLNIPCLVAARGNDLDRDAFRPERQAGILHALAQADAVTAVSHSLAREACALGAEQVGVIPNGVDAQRFRPVGKDGDLVGTLAFEGAFPVIGFVGEARQKKGLPTLLEAFKRLHAKYPKAKLLMMGGIREQDRALFDIFKAQHPELAEAIREGGYVYSGALPKYYAVMDVLWHPSYQDGMPNAILEAMACERLSVGTRVGGIPDVLEAERYGDLLVPPHDPDALVAATEALMADTERWAERERAAREDVIQRFSPEAEVQAYLALYETLIAPTPSSA